jgi:hypothetical protein
MKLFDKIFRRKKQKEPNVAVSASKPESSEINPKTCPHNNGYVTAEGGLSQNFVCTRCGALVNNTPFGKELIMRDARKRFPELSELDVEAWERDKKEKVEFT